MTKQSSYRQQLSRTQNVPQQSEGSGALIQELVDDNDGILVPNTLASTTLLQEILKELQITNTHLEIITGQLVREGDIER